MFSWFQYCTQDMLSPEIAPPLNPMHNLAFLMPIYPT